MAQGGEDGGGLNLLSEAQIRRNSFFIKGHTNVVELDMNGRTKIKAKVKTHSDAVRAEDHIRLKHMEILMQKWKENDGELTEQEFRDVFHQVIGGSLGERFEEHVSFLFRKMDTNQDETVDWDEFCTYMMVGLQEKDDLDNERENPVMVCPVLFETSHRTAIVKVMNIPSPPRFVTVSEDGLVIFWSNKIKQNNQLRLDEEAFVHAKSLRVTDAAYLTNAQRMIVLATTSRDLRFYNSVTGVPYQKVDIDAIAMCMDYHFNPSSPDHASLYVGDMDGYITVFKFNQASSGRLFNDPSTEWQRDRVNWKDLQTVKKGSKEATKVTCERIRIHREEGSAMMNQSVSKVMYVPQLDGFFSCASTTTNALVFFDAGKSTARSFTIHKGCTDFDFFMDRDDGHHLIATGGNDTKLRLWNPYVPNTPNAVLSGHRSSIVHVMFNPSHGQVITMSDLEIIKIWDIKQRVCLNTLGNIIPHKLMQASTKSTRVFWHEPAQSLLAATYTELACIQLSRNNVTASHTAHDMPISAMAYVPEFNVLATGGYGGTINVWDLSSGAKVMEFESAHTGAAVSCLAVGYGGRRLISGASNGEIFVWNTLSGVVLQRLVKQDAREVIGVLSTKDRIYSAGWDGKLVSFLHQHDVDIAKAPIMIDEDSKWSALEHHNDDILAMDNVGESLLATGSFDGEVIVWNLKLARAVKKFDSRTYRKKLNVLKTKAKTKHLPKVAANARTAVDAICWLKNRVKSVKSGSSTATIAVSCDGGCVCFWNALKGDMYGGFYAVSDKFGYESVQGMAVDNANEKLYTGDSLGFVRVFDIKTYCLTGDDTHAPKMLREWRAHVQAISCLVFVETANVVITGSTDQSVRVWGALNGDFIGSFGGASMWSLSSGEMSQRVESKRNRASVGMNSVASSPDGAVFSSGSHHDDDDGEADDAPTEFMNLATGTIQRRGGRKKGRNGADQEGDSLKLPPIHIKSSGSQLTSLGEDQEETSFPGGGDDDDGNHLQVSSEPRSRRSTDVAASAYMGEFKLPHVPGALKESSDSLDFTIDLNNLPSADDYKDTDLETLALDKDRASVLGKAYSKKALEWQTDKHSWRQVTPRPDMTKAAKEGLMVCVPYNTLRLGKMDEIESVRAPSAVNESQKRLERLTQETEENSMVPADSRRNRRRAQRRSTVAKFKKGMVVAGLAANGMGAFSGLSLPAMK